MSATQSNRTHNCPLVKGTNSASASTSTRVDYLNRILQLAWERGWSARPQLDAGDILQVGMRGSPAVRVHDYVEWIERLDSLTTALRHEARLNPLGQTIAYGQLVRMVRQRAKLETLWQQHPAILKQPVPPPIIVLGHMRAGTTRMQRMLASDNRFSATRFCDSWHPVPTGVLDWRPAKAWAVLKSIGLLNPEFASIHPTSPTAVDEEIGWLGLGFSSTPFDAQWHIPSFVNANSKRDASSTYRLMRRIIQTQQWHDKGPPRPRVLKVPQFMEDIDALLSVFPEARIVHVTRDPVEVVASSCSLVANQRTIQSDTVDFFQIGREWLDRTLRRETIAAARLARHNFPTTVVDYGQMNTEWRATIADIYRSLGLEITDQTLSQMESFHSNPKARNAPHSYRLQDFGLTPCDVREAFASTGASPQPNFAGAPDHCPVNTALRFSTKAFVPSVASVELPAIL